MEGDEGGRLLDWVATKNLQITPLKLPISTSKQLQLKYFHSMLGIEHKHTLV